MKILHVNTHQNGGAARAAIRLHEGLCQAGKDSHMMLGYGKRSSKVMIYQQSQSLVSRIQRKLKREQISRDFCNYTSSRPSGLEAFSDDRSEYGRDVISQLPKCDIINLHWTARFLDYGCFFRHTSQPLVWTLHDMNPFTGGCHYAGKCQAFHDQCGSCPQLGSAKKNDLSASIWLRKQKALSEMSSSLHIVTPSQWLKTQVELSRLFKGLPVSVIANGLDTKVFTPRYVTGFKSAIGIPEQAKVVLFAADSTNNKRKGFSLLLKAVQSIQLKDEVYFLSMGGGDISNQFSRHVHLGNISNDILMSVIYSIADIFVIPSREDNLPNTVLESMACGTPVIGFNIGGIPDMVSTGKTGLLVELENIQALKESMVYLLENPERLEYMGVQCRQLAEERYDLSVQAKHYSSLYESLIDRKCA